MSVDFAKRIQELKKQVVETIDELEPINAKLVAVDHDVINKPSHYQFEIEVYDIIEILLKGNPNYKEVDAYNIGNVIKYLFRAGLKGEFYEDIGKAEWYLKAIKEKENENK